MTRAQAEALIAYIESFVVMHAAVHTAARHADPLAAATMLTHQAVEARAAFLATTDVTVDPPEPEPMPPPAGNIHYLGNTSESVCGRGIPEWPAVDRWTSIWARVTCPACKAKAP